MSGEAAQLQLFTFFLTNMLSPVKIWRNQKKVRKMLGFEGTIISWTKVYVPPSGFSSQAPYVIAIVKFDRGICHTAQLVDFDESRLGIGQRVVSILRRTRDPDPEEVIPYGIKFRPI